MLQFSSNYGAKRCKIDTFSLRQEKKHSREHLSSETHTGGAGRHCGDRRWNKKEEEAGDFKEGGRERVNGARVSPAKVVKG